MARHASHTLEARLTREPAPPEVAYPLFAPGQSALESFRFKLCPDCGFQPGRAWCIKVGNDASAAIPSEPFLPARRVCARGWWRRLRQRGSPAQLATVAWAATQRSFFRDPFARRMASGWPKAALAGKRCWLRLFHAVRVGRKDLSPRQ